MVLNLLDMPSVRSWLKISWYCIQEQKIWPTFLDENCKQAYRREVLWIYFMLYQLFLCISHDSKKLMNDIQSTLTFKNYKVETPDFYLG